MQLLLFDFAWQCRPILRLPMRMFNHFFFTIIKDFLQVYKVFAIIIFFLNHDMCFLGWPIEARNGQELNKLKWLMRAHAIIMCAHAIILRAHAMTNACPRNDKCVPTQWLMRGHAIIMRAHAIIMRDHAKIMRAHAIVSTWPAACETPLESWLVRLHILG